MILISAVPVGPVAPQIFVGAGVNPTDLTFDRGECLTLFLGEAATSSCGDLQIAHLLPVMQSFNKTFAPVLIYTANQASPLVKVRVDVTLPAGGTVPDSVTAALSLNGAAAQSRKWSGSHWSPGTTLRLVAQSTTTSGTAVLSYTLTVTNWYGSTPYSTNKSASVLHVSRTTSPFGAGWWLAGLEELKSVGQTQMLWVGGDGSARVYNKINSTLWRGVNRLRPDSIIYDGGAGHYVREAPGGVEVRFNTSGQHVQTRDRNGVTTTFSYVSGRLDRITLPTASTSRYYQFTYTSGKLSSVAAHGRTTQVSIGSNRINSITDPDGLVTTFTYPSGSSVLVQFREATGGTKSEFLYTAANHVRFVRRYLAASPHIETEYRPQESLGLDNSGDFKPLRPFELHTWIDGPRPSRNDTTRFYVNAYGQPDSVRDALGYWASRVRSRDVSFPALVRGLQFANGRKISATYNSKGRVTSVIDSLAVGGSYPTTTYRWTNTTCPDFPTSIRQPMGDSVAIGYTATCNRQWQQDNRGTSSRVNFGYLSDGRLSTITPPLSAQTQFTYDAQVGNLATVSQGGITTSYQRDTWGAVRFTTIPVTATTSRYQRIAFDNAGRDTLVVDSAAGSWIRTRRHYTAGLFDTLRTVTSPDPNGIGTVTIGYTYDRLGRITREVGGGRNVTWGYDEAGNVTSGGPRPATRTYDDNNQMATEGSSQFTYDAVGNLTRADNSYARVRMAYDGAGRMVADTQWIAQFNTSTKQPNGFSGSSHVYVIRYGYDLNSRMTWQQHSSNLAPSASQDSIAYTYESWGPLNTMLDVMGNVYDVNYDVENRPLYLNRQLTGGGWVRDSLYYDNLSRLTRRVVRSSTAGQVMLERPLYDYVDRMTKEQEKGYDYQYSALDPLTQGAAGAGVEWFTTDALGRRTSSNSKIGTYPAITNYFYQAGTGTLRYTQHYGMNIDTTTYQFNSYGNEQYQERRQPVGFGFNPDTLITRTDFVYDGNLTLTKTIFTADTVVPGGGIPYPTYQSYRKEEGYWYDALGRRVLTWSWKQSNCPNKDPSSGCLSTVTRTVWSGNQIAYEIRAPWSTPDSDTSTGNHYGRVGYLHAGAIDRPIALWKGTQVVHPHLNARGVFPLGTCGTSLCSSSQIDFPGNRLSVFGADANPPSNGPVSWYGSLITGQLDASGMLYRRNRYVDPRNGSFTQSDPVGIAGGLNLYGFSNGDPVNFSDPFGLCPIGDERNLDVSDCPNDVKGNILRALDSYGGEEGKAALRTIVEEELDIVILDSHSFGSRCGPGASTACLNSREIILNEEHTFGDFVVRVRHETVHAQFDYLFVHEEVLAWRSALNLYDGLPMNLRRHSDYVGPSIRRRAEPQRFYRSIYETARRCVMEGTCPGR